MHTFQPYPIDLMEMNPFTKIGKEWMLITAGDEKKANTMTASWSGVIFVADNLRQINTRFPSSI